MNTLSEELTTLYNSKWENLIKQLKANGLRDQLQCPFLISALRISDIEKKREENKLCVEVKPENEAWYTHADIRIMFFGKEPYMWEKWDEDMKTPDVGDLMYTYEKFLGDNYVPYKNGGYFDQDKLRSRLFKFSINGILSCLMEEMEKSYPGKTISMIWNNISKLSAVTKSGGGPVDASVHEIEHKYFHVIPKEVEILKPNILIFFTGPGESTYYKYIQENFTVDGNPSPLASLSVHDVAKLPIREVELAYKTHHPNSTISDESHWNNYHAILNDIKENIDKLLKKE